MFEYIKRVSLSISFINEKIDENQVGFKNLLNRLSLELLEIAQSFRLDVFNISDLNKLESKILFLIDLIDFGRISGFVSSMNAQVFMDSQIAFLKHILNLKEQKNQLYLSSNHLQELDEKMARITGKELAQSKISEENNTSNFDFTTLPTIKKDSPKVVAETPKKILEESMITPISKEIFPETLEEELEARRIRILKILTAGGESIKEIANKMRDVNEKTIQRDLLGLMRDKRVIMLGKKRWAKYYLK